jgi:hypothetical protein
MMNEADLRRMYNQVVARISVEMATETFMPVWSLKVEKMKKTKERRKYVDCNGKHKIHSARNFRGTTEKYAKTHI